MDSTNNTKQTAEKNSPSISLEVIYQDQFLVAINKPSGMLVHRTRADFHETLFVIQILRDQLGEKVFPLHRLDKPTSGVLLFALSAQIARLMGKAFESGQMDKTYLAIVRGFTDLSGRIEHPLKEKYDPATDHPFIQDKPPQSAQTDYLRLATLTLPHAVDKYPSARYSLLEIKPKTGRRHQIRRHLKHIAHPIIGDTSYGKGSHNRFFREHFGLTRLLLHASRLKFSHPMNRQIIELEAKLDSGFQDISDLFAV